MKLYYSPGACSLAPHIVLNEAGLPYSAEKVDLRSKKTAAGADFTCVNPKGYVPALELDDGSVLTEGPAIDQYLADQVPDSGLAPPAGTLARYRLLEWLNYITAELHKQFGPFFHGGTEQEKKAQRDKLGQRLGYIETQLKDKQYLLGDVFTVADAYLFVILTWLPKAQVDLAAWPALSAYFARVKARPKVQAALKAEGLAA